MPMVSRGKPKHEWPQMCGRGQLQAFNDKLLVQMTQKQRKRAGVQLHPPPILWVEIVDFLFPKTHKRVPGRLYLEMKGPLSGCRKLADGQSGHFLRERLRCCLAFSAWLGSQQWDVPPFSLKSVELSTARRCHQDVTFDASSLFPYPDIRSHSQGNSHYSPEIQCFWPLTKSQARSLIASGAYAMGLQDECPRSSFRFGH